jgi:inhibitor of KinA
VPAGSVGLTGRQTGIYPLERPGGWPIIGRTPLTIVDVADRFFPLAVGDRVRFSRIDDAEYARLDGERLR